MFAKLEFITCMYTRYLIIFHYREYCSEAARDGKILKVKKLIMKGVPCVDIGIDISGAVDKLQVR